MSTSRRRRAPHTHGDEAGTASGDSAEASADDPESVARSIALRKLAAAPQTRAQLDDAMAAKGVPEEVRAQVLGRFADVGLIDDAAFARAWVDSRHTGRGLSQRALSHELRKRGVEGSTADDAASSVTPEREEEMARALVSRKLPSMTRLDPAAKTRRLAGMLARKGYPPGLSYRVVREAIADDGVDESELPPESI